MGWGGGLGGLQKNSGGSQGGLECLGGPGAVWGRCPPPVQQPPELTEAPPEQLVVFPSDDAVLKCAASGNPPVQFRWTRDGRPFPSPSLSPAELAGVSVSPGGGTLVINASLAGRLQGRFRCEATNALGTALSPESRVIAETPPQWPKEKVTPVQVEEGDPVVLPCEPPPSAVPPRIYWLNSRIVHIAQDARVSMGQDGFLYFANAQVGDSHPDYICHAHYLGPRTIIQKEPLVLRVTPSNSVKSRPPRLVVPRDPQPTHVALRGETLVLECIAEGLPTPWVWWRRLNAPLPPGRAVLDNFNHTLRLLNVSEADDGDYECAATNGLGTARRSHRVTEHWAVGLNRVSGGRAYPGPGRRLDCQVGGKPRPRVSWSLNGVPIDELPDPGRRTLRDGALILSRLEPNDSMVAQCEASNSHGRLLANAFVYVVELPVQILTPDSALYTVVENQTAFLHCRAFGAPAPTPALQDDRAFAFTNGSLRLGRRRPLGGASACTRAVAHSNASVSARLDVRAATRIEVPPQSVTAKKGETVTFTCGATWDPGLEPRGLLWLRDGSPVLESADSDKFSVAGDTLTVAGVDYPDQGRFRCRAWTRLDAAEAEAELRVVGRPGPVQDVQVREPSERQVRLSWTPGEEHNSPVEKFVVEQEEGIFSPGRFEEVLTVPGVQPWAQLALSPYGRYRFRVLAVNGYGRGEPSAPSATVSTDPAAPERYPMGVKGEGNETNNLVITWQVRGHFGGIWGILGGFRGPGGIWGAWDGPQTPPVPLVYPENVGVEILNSTSVRVTWSLSRASSDLRGHLRGYRVLYWRDGWVGEHPRPPGSPEPPPQPGALTVPGEAGGALLGALQPWSRYRLQVLVFNGRGAGPPSAEIRFHTPEGVPGPPEELRVERLGDTALSLEWRRPRHPNGVLRDLGALGGDLGALGGDLGALGGTWGTLGRTGKGFGAISWYFGTEPHWEKRGRGLGVFGRSLGYLEGVFGPPDPPARPAAEEPWRSSGRANSSLGRYRLGDLRPGTSYRVQFVGRNHSGERVAFWESEVHTNGTLLPRPAGGFATEGWFIGFVSAAVLLLLLLLILCFIKRSKGGKYSVKDKEDTQVDSEARPMKDETFGEYRDGEEKASGSSGRSLGAAGAALGSDDSLAGYGGSADVQFNEDGSFIGQYSGARGTAAGSSGPASPSAAAPLD
uniref:Neural cell adhesion molecule L1 n=1 Tax=Geospiza parvula TaxID=87175 RepID=A0A8C3NSF2_GEOPR